MDNHNSKISWNDFQKVEMRVGTVVSIEPFPQARNPSFKIQVDFGPKGILKSSAQLTEVYDTKDLLGKQVVAVVNFPPKQIATMMSECLILGAMEGSKVTVISPTHKVPNGLRIG